MTPSDVERQPNIAVCPSCNGQIDVTGHEIGTIIECPHCTHQFPVTRQLGDFLLEREIGSGGMGSVYVGRDLKLNRTVAVKVLKQALNRDEKFIQTFLTEAQITASLNHPNIVQVYAFGEIDEQYYLVMEYIPGGSLDDQIVERGKIPELEVLQIGIAVAEGLDFALQNGLIHRDIKPGNILFGEGNTPKVVDFGLSLGTGQTDQFDGEIWGTPYYVAPEKVEEEVEDFRSDMYSLATTLFHAIAGRPPYQDEDEEKIVMMHVQGQSVSIKTFAPGTSKETNLTVRKAMARNPAERFQSYGELIDQLDEVRRRLLDTRSRAQQPNNKDYQVVHTDENSAMGAIMAFVGLVIIVVLVLLVWLKPDLFFETPSPLEETEEVQPEKA